MLTGIHFYNQTVKKAVSVFGTLFNNIKIVKPGKAEIRVPIAYGPAQKFLTRLQDAGADTDRIALKLPRMSFEINSMEYDAERALNKMNKVTSSTGPHWKAPTKPPAVVDIAGTSRVKSFSVTKTPGESWKAILCLLK